MNTLYVKVYHLKINMSNIHKYKQNIALKNDQHTIDSTQRLMELIRIISRIMIVPARTIMIGSCSCKGKMCVHALI